VSRSPLHRGGEGLGVGPLPGDEVVGDGADAGEVASPLDLAVDVVVAPTVVPRAPDVDDWTVR